MRKVRRVVSACDHKEVVEILAMKKEPNRVAGGN